MIHLILKLLSKHIIFHQTYIINRGQIVEFILGLLPLFIVLPQETIIVFTTIIQIKTCWILFVCLFPSVASEVHF